jgi:hypothetical protein
LVYVSANVFLSRVRSGSHYRAQRREQKLRWRRAYEQRRRQRFGHRLAKLLRRDEELLARARVHWIVYTPAFLVVAIGVIELIYNPSTYHVGWLVFGLLLYLAAEIYRNSVELAATTRRVIVIPGLFCAIQYPPRVATYYSERSLIGAVLGFGTVTIYGDKVTTVRFLAWPEEFAGAAQARGRI